MFLASAPELQVRHHAIFQSEVLEGKAESDKATRPTQSSTTPKARLARVYYLGMPAKRTPTQDLGKPAYQNYQMMCTRTLDTLFSYCESLAALSGRSLQRGTVFAKVLTENDDASKHGVLIPIEAYDHFPELEILDPTQNKTRKFDAFDRLSNSRKALSYIYYKRYPERRVTCLNSAFNDRGCGLRLGVFLRAEHTDGTTGYYVDLARQGTDSDFAALASLLFGAKVAPVPGVFILRDLDSPPFNPDPALNSLLALFDSIRDRGWIESMRSGDTGIGYTFESLLGIKENNDKRADYRGIEVKCKQMKEVGGAGKINLFQQAPIWSAKLSALERIRLMGQADDAGRYSCFSQVTTTPNNLGLYLEPQTASSQIGLLKHSNSLGRWSFATLEARLQEKHARAVFVKAAVQPSGLGQRFRYDELVYCEQPAIRKFVRLVQERHIVFEFIMSEKENGRVRNHGYPWRLLNEGYLSELFSLQVKLR